MQNIKHLDEATARSRKSLLEQSTLHPVSSLKFFIFTRLAKWLHQPISWQARTFWGVELKGYFPEPVFSYIYLYGFLEEAVTKMVVKYLKPGMTFVDMGAHLGYFSTLAASIVGDKGRVFSFEPTPETYKLLLANVNASTNTVTNNNALWSENAIVDLVDYGAGISGSNGFVGVRMSESKLQETRPRIFKISALKWDDYSTNFNVKANFVKIDAESAEHAILMGMKNTLKKHKPILVIEIGDKPEQKGRTEAIIRQLESLNYKTMEYFENGFRNHKKRNSYLNLYENLLFLPK